uniref:PHD-type domain-containing protein n=1 Tax=Anopheles maculatus TaxID=74869 RepID=A0A182STD4_9DIPT
MAKTCFLCKSSVDNELLFGRFYSKWKLTVHYYCLRGSNDTVGIFGFLESDIRKENERTKKCRCYICKHMHANVSCCSKKCLRTFHTVCGIMNGCLSHYTDTYQSWCSAHVPLEPDSDPHSPEEACSICYDEMGQYDLITSIKAPCCRNGWFHQRCLAQYAESAGYFFKCPLCKNEDKFVAEVPRRGVFVPERDAAWELEPNAFQEQLQRPTACDAEDCKCEQGRTIDSRQWQLVICGSCGSTCRHRQCMEQTAEGPQAYLCQLCRPIVGERLSLLENLVDSSDCSDDDTASRSTSVSLSRTFRSKYLSATSGSGESGVHCSSSDEPFANIRRLAHSSGSRLTDGSDSDRSDGSSIQVRRFVRQNTGKRVRRLLSDGSDDAKRSEDTHHSTDTLPMRIKRSPTMHTDDRSSDTSDRIDVRLTRQLTRRLSSQSDSSKRSSSESTNINEIQRPQCSTKRRNVIASSSDESEKHSHELDDRLLDTKCGRVNARVDSVSSHSASEWDENSNITDTAVPLSIDRSPPKRDQDDKTNASQTSSENVSTTLTGRRTRRHTTKQRSTSESSIELKTENPKRSSARSASSGKRTEEDGKTAAAGTVTADKHDCAPHNKRRRVFRERPNRPNQSNPGKQLQQDPPALGRQQKSMLQFVTVTSTQKASALDSDDSSDLSTDETVSPFGNSNKMTSRETGPISRKRTRATSKRRRTRSPKKKSNAAAPATDHSTDKKQSPPAPTSSKASVQHRTTPPNRTTAAVHKDKGQKNILNYFNRC